MLDRMSFPSKSGLDDKMKAYSISSVFSIKNNIQLPSRIVVEIKPSNPIGESLGRTKQELSDSEKRAGKKGWMGKVK